MQKLVGSRVRFDYPDAFTSLPDYTAHAGQIVSVVRPLDPATEYDDQGERMYVVRADDGWEGHAFRSELVEDDQ
jgi:hypothetical protein